MYYTHDPDIPGHRSFLSDNLCSQAPCTHTHTHTHTHTETLSGRDVTYQRWNFYYCLVTVREIQSLQCISTLCGYKNCEFLFLHGRFIKMYNMVESKNTGSKIIDY